MANEFYNIRKRLARGKKHISEFQRETTNFMAEDIGAPIVEMDTDGTTELHKFKLIEPLPDALGDLAFDALNNLRSALDQAGYASAVLSGKTAPKACKFPVAPTVPDFENNVRGGCKDLPQEISALFASFKAYKGGNDVLWALNELTNTNKHKLLVPVAMSTEKTTVSWFEATGRPTFFEPEWDRTKNEIIFAKIAAGEKFDYELDIVAFVAFDHVEIPRSYPAASILDMMATEVESVIEATEVECRHIGLI